MKANKISASISIDPALKKRLEKLAHDDWRSFSSLVEKILKDFVDRPGKSKEAA